MHLKCLLTIDMDIELIYLNGFRQIKLRFRPIKFMLVNSDWKESIKSDWMDNICIWRIYFETCFDNNIHLCA